MLVIVAPPIVVGACVVNGKDSMLSIIYCQANVFASVCTQVSQWQRQQCDRVADLIKNKRFEACIDLESNNEFIPVIVSCFDTIHNKAYGSAKPNWARKKTAT